MPGRHEYAAGVTRTPGQRLPNPVAALSDLKTIGSSSMVAGAEASVAADGSFWRFHATSVLAGDDVLVVAPANSAPGRWLRLPGSTLLTLPITFATADAAVLLTVPAGCLLSVEEPFWTVSTSFTGGTASAIGVSSNKTGFTTKGDLLGGATGDVAATLVSTGALAKMGTIGAGFDTLAKRRVLWAPAETIRFDRITSAFTAGVGAVNLKCNVLQNNGA